MTQGTCTCMARINSKVYTVELFVLSSPCYLILLLMFGTPNIVSMLLFMRRARIEKINPKNSQTENLSPI